MTVAPDREQIAQFARAAFAEAPPHSFVTLRSFHDDKPAGAEPPFQSRYVSLDEDDDLECLIAEPTGWRFLPLSAPGR